METVEEKINNILANWNPINVPEFLADEEYKNYVQAILQSCHNKETLFNCMLDILINKMGLGFDVTNKIHVKDLNNVCDEIWEVIGVRR